MSDQELKEYLELQVSALDRLFTERIATMIRTVEKTEAQLDERLRLAQKEYESRLKVLEISKAHSEGKLLAISTIVAIVVSIVVGGVVHQILK